MICISASSLYCNWIYLQNMEGRQRGVGAGEVSIIK
jgi:hypothetical protein